MLGPLALSSPLAADTTSGAYRAGQVFVVLAICVGGLVLVVRGLRGRPGVTGERRYRPGLIGAGALVLLLNGVTVAQGDLARDEAQQADGRPPPPPGFQRDNPFAGLQSPGEDPPPARVLLSPAEVIGLPRQQATSEELTRAIVEEFPVPEATDRQAGVYGTGPDVLVLATAVPVGDQLRLALASARDGVAADGAVLDGDGLVVEPDALGGLVRCWETSQEGAPVAVCILVEPGSIVVVLDYAVADLVAAGQRAVQVRAATVS